MSRDTVVKILVALGLVTLAIESRYLHREVVTENFIGWIPTIASVVGVVACLLALSRSSKLRTAGAVVFVVLAITGVVGVYYHTELKADRFMKLFAESGKPMIAYAEEADRDKEKEKGKGENKEEDIPPPLAPLALSGLCLIGAVVSWSKPKSGGS